MYTFKCIYYFVWRPQGRRQLNTKGTGGLVVRDEIVRTYIYINIYLHTYKIYIVSCGGRRKAGGRAPT